MKHGSLLGLLVFGLMAGTIPAQDEPKPLTLKEHLNLDPRNSFFGYHRWVPQKEPLSREERLARAGCPQNYWPWARCPNDRHYLGYYVGGGAAIGGEERCDQCEGTWGWDYKLPWQRVRLNWYHGSRRQGGEGQYNPDSHNNPLANLP